jgi:hypothetical protein
VNARDNLLRVLRHDHPHWVPNGMEAVVTLSPPVIERPDQEGYDHFGVHWSYSADAEGGTFPTRGAHTITDLSRWREQIQLPDIEALDWSRVAAQADAVDRREFLVQGFVEMGLFERSWLLLSMEEALIAYLTEPAYMHELLVTLADYKISLIRKFHAVAKLDLLWYGDDWGTQNQLFLPPDLWRKCLKPHVGRVYACAQSLRIVLNQHSCGKIDTIMGDLVQMGMGMWNPCQPCNDLAGMKRKYGQWITFCGGIDSQFVLGRPGVTEGEVRAEVRKRIDDLADGGGYIAMPSHSVPYDPELIVAMNDEITHYGRAYYLHATRPMTTGA